MQAIKSETFAAFIQAIINRKTFHFINPAEQGRPPESAGKKSSVNLPAWRAQCICAAAYKWKPIHEPEFLIWELISDEKLSLTKLSIKPIVSTGNKMKRSPSNHSF